MPASAWPTSLLATYKGSGRIGGQAAVGGALLVLAAAAWVATDLSMAGMDAGPGTDPGTLGFFISTWLVMMAAMMLPAITPMVLAYRAFDSQEQVGRRITKAADLGLFVACYLAVWAVAGLAAYVLLEAGRSLDGGLFAWHRTGRWVTAAVLGTAAAYQLTPSKRACLLRCTERRAFLLKSWRGGRVSAVRLGLGHGAWCVGCCWALMAALFALGAMSIAWMALISALIAAERLLPWRAPVGAGIASLLAALALGVAIAPARIPMLTMPGSAAAMRAMGMHAWGHMRMSRPAGAGSRRTSMSGHTPRSAPAGDRTTGSGN